MPKFFTQFHHEKVAGLVCKTPSKTQPQFKFECDINNVVKGLVQSSLPANTTNAIYGIKYDVNSYMDALNVVADARSNFACLPSSTREYFKNDPKNMLEFVQNENNYDKAIELGLIDKEKAIKYKQSKNNSKAAISISESQSKPVNQVTANNDIAVNSNFQN